MPIDFLKTIWLKNSLRFNMNMENMFILRNTCVDPFMARRIDHCMKSRLPRPSTCKANVDIDVNVVVYVDSRFCIARNRVNKH